MRVLLVVLLAATAAATLFVLVKGLVGMAQAPSELNAARSQVLMQKRVAYQAIAILFASALLALAR
jgi:hypothetical protein